MSQTHDPLFTPPGEQDMPMMPEWLVRGVNALAAHSLFYSANALDQMRHRSSEVTEEVEVLRDVAYGPDASWHRLDIWRPAQEHPAQLVDTATSERALRPALFFVHGGGFRTMSKRTHWFFARAFARMGFVVFTIDYRLGPRYLFPLPLQDASQALLWVVEHAERYGADASTMTFAGESAGANLITALTAMMARERAGLPWAERVFEQGVMPVALLSMCGLLQVSDPGRHERRGVAKWMTGPIFDAQKSYLGEALDENAEARALADPLCVFERSGALERRLPPLMLNVGALDPLIDDSRRLQRAWRGAPAELNVYARSGHSFMAFMWTRNAAQCWSDMHGFLKAQGALNASSHGDLPLQIAV